MSNAGHHDSFCRPVAAQLIGNDDAWSASDGMQQLAEEPDCSKAIPLWLDENIENNTVLIDRSPEIMPHTVNVEEDLIQMPLVMNLFARLHELGNTIVMVTHEHEVADFAERVIHIRDGKVEKDERKA